MLLKLLILLVGVACVMGIKVTPHQQPHQILSGSASADDAKCMLFLFVLEFI